MRQKKNSSPFEKLFRNKSLLRTALTHPSHRGKSTTESANNFQRLEFLGDSVLGLVISHKLFRERLKAHEGELSHARSLMVSKKELANQALTLKLDKWMAISGQKNAEMSPKILADGLEALIGALFLDRGLKPAADFIEKIFKKRKKTTVESVNIENPKGLLQELVQKRWKELPEYITIPHKKGFHSTVLIPKGKAIGIAKSKKESQEAAALKILPRLQKFLEKDQD